MHIEKLKAIKVFDKSKEIKFEECIEEHFLIS